MWREEGHEKRQDKTECEEGEKSRKCRARNETAIRADKKSEFSRTIKQTKLKQTMNF